MALNYEDFSGAFKEAKDGKTLGFGLHGVVMPTVIFQLAIPPQVNTCSTVSPYTQC